MTNSLSRPERLALGLLRVVPKNLLSRLVGRLAEVPLPTALRAPAWGATGRVLGVDFSELATPLREHARFQDFFTRPLPAWARPIDPDPRAFVSPCDGAWGQSGRVENGTLLQVKGRPYSLAELLGEDASHFEGGAFATLYLSPRDYHRFHAPCRLRVDRLRHLPGSLWPVNRLGVLGVDGLFAKNERLVAFADALAPSGEPIGRLALVAVGATVVGKVRVTFDELATQETSRGDRHGDQRSRERSYDPAVEIARGEEWGRFEFGSTLVLVAEPGVVDLAVEEPGAPVRLGRRVGTLDSR